MKGTAHDFCVLAMGIVAAGFVPNASNAWDRNPHRGKAGDAFAIGAGRLRRVTGPSFCMTSVLVCVVTI